SGTGPGRPSGTGLVSVGGGGQPAGRCGSTSTSRVVTVVLGGAAELVVGAVVDGVEVRRASSSNPDATSAAPATTRIPRTASAATDPRRRRGRAPPRRSSGGSGAAPGSGTGPECSGGTGGECGTGASGGLGPCRARSDPWVALERAEPREALEVARGEARHRRARAGVHQLRGIVDVTQPHQVSELVRDDGAGPGPPVRLLEHPGEVLLVQDHRTAHQHAAGGDRPARLG